MAQKSSKALLLRKWTKLILNFHLKNNWFFFFNYLSWHEFSFNGFFCCNFMQKKQKKKTNSLIKDCPRSCKSLPQVKAKTLWTLFSLYWEQCWSSYSDNLLGTFWTHRCACFKPFLKPKPPHWHTAWKVKFESKMLNTSFKCVYQSFSILSII